MEVSASNPTPTGPGGRSVTGILLVDPRRGPVADNERRRLSDAVRDRGWMLTVRTGVATALAELCVMDEEESSREAWGLPPRGDVVLVVACPLDEHIEMQLRRAVMTYAPRTRSYRWTGVALVPDDHDPSHPPGVPRADWSPRSDARPSSPSNTDQRPEASDGPTPKTAHPRPLPSDPGQLTPSSSPTPSARLAEGIRPPGAGSRVPLPEPHVSLEHHR